MYEYKIKEEMRAELNNTAKKQFKQLNEPYKGRIAEAIDGLEKEPPQGNIKKLRGRKGYRVTVGDYRVLFDINKELNFIDVFKIAPRSGVYKEN